MSVFVPVCIWCASSFRAPLHWIHVVMSLFLAALDPSGAGYSLFQHLTPVSSGAFGGLAVASAFMAAVTVSCATLPYTAVFTIPSSVPDTTPFLLQQVYTRKCVLRDGITRGPCILSLTSVLALCCVVSVCVC